MNEKLCSGLAALNFCIAIGLLIPLSLADFPDTFRQLAALPGSEVFAPGALGFLLIHLALVATSSAFVFVALSRDQTRWATPAAVVVSIAAIASSIINPYWLGHISLLQSLWFLFVEVKHFQRAQPRGD